MTILASQITSLTVVYSIVYSGVNQRKHQSTASLAFVREIHRGPVNFPHKWPVTRKMFPFDDVIMTSTTRHDKSEAIWLHLDKQAQTFFIRVQSKRNYIMTSQQTDGRHESFMHIMTLHCIFCIFSKSYHQFSLITHQALLNIVKWTSIQSAAIFNQEHEFRYCVFAKVFFNRFHSINTVCWNVSYKKQVL